MDKMPVRIFVHEGAVYADVAEFVDAIVQDLMKAPPEMVASRDEIVYALKRYSADAQQAKEEVRDNG